MTIQAKALVRLTGIILSLSLFTTIAAKAQAGAGDSGSTESYNINDGSVIIDQAGDYTITGTGVETGNTIRVVLDSKEAVANITIKDVNIIKSDPEECPFNIKQGTVNLTLVGDGNVLEARDQCAALQVSKNSVLVITEKSTGKLTATGGARGAGIGGGTGYSVGTITIAGGTVDARGGNGGAGIGGGDSNPVGSIIIISGGTVKATGGLKGAGIGGGNSSFIGTITISGGTVDAKGGSMGSGIGGGYGSSGVSITISGGKITTKGNIGDGEDGSGATCTISGGTIVCKSFTSDLTISGGSVRTDDNSVDKNGKVMAVVKGSPKELPANSKVTSITIGKETYNWTDVYTDENGMLYLYLQQDQPGSATVTIGGNEYTANASREYDITKGPITIKAAGDYAIVGGGTQTGNTIEVELKDGGIANITIEGVDISKVGTSECPFNIIQGTVNLRLVGDGNVLEAGDYCAALQVSANSVLVITGESTGKLTARGGSDGAGIGGGNKGSVGSITIAGGTVEATGGARAADIGGGDGGTGGTIDISGGTVTAAGENEVGIGWVGIGTGGTITISGGKVTTTGNIGDGGNMQNPAQGTISGGTIVCKSISPTLSITGGSVRTEDNSVVNGKVMAVVKGFPKGEITSITIDEVMYGSKDVYTDENGKLYLYIPQGKPASVTLEIGKQKYTLPAIREYDITNGSVAITAAGDYAIVGGGTQTGNAITVELGKKEDVANITIEGVNISKVGTSECPFNIKQGTVNLTLVGKDDKLQAGYGYAALQVSKDSKLVITEKSTGKLTATGGTYGAGIGGGDQSSVGSITIEGGTVTATGGDGGAGIGGGYSSPAGSITIAGGTVEATGGDGGAGIGGGYGSDVGSITIEGGTVTATGGDGGAGIGGGERGSVGYISIAGGTVEATGGDRGAGIGGGLNSSGGTISISGGKITTEGNIGDGEYGSGATGEIKGGTIVCKSISPTLSITGGSVRTKDNSFVGDKGMAVVKGLPNETEVKSIQINEAPYGSTDVFTDKNGQLYLYIPKAGAVPVSITIDDKVYTLHVTLEVITISDKIDYNKSDHEGKSITIASTGTFTINAPDASVIDLTIDKGGKLLTNKELEVKGGFTVDLKANEQKWITFCSPVPLKLLNQRWATGAGDEKCLFLKSGFTTANDQKWTFEQSIKEDTPYLIGVPTGVVAFTLYAQNVKLPGRKEDISINPPSGFDNNLLFRANTSLTEQTLKDIYVLDIDRQKLVLKTEDYILKPFEAYFIASPATRNMLKTISLLGSDGQPTGIAEVKVQKNTNFKAYSNSPGTLTFENQGEPAAVIVVNALGKGMFVYSNFTGSKHLYGLSAGVYFVRSNKEVKTVIVY